MLFEDLGCGLGEQKFRLSLLLLAFLTQEVRLSLKPAQEQPLAWRLRLENLRRHFERMNRETFETISEARPARFPGNGGKATGGCSNAIQQQSN